MFRLRDVRKHHKMSQQELASVLGVTQATLSGWETEKYEIDTKSLIFCSEYFNVSTDYLLGRSDNVISSNDEQVLNLFEKSDENIVLLSRKNGSRKKYTLSDAQTNIVENLLSEFASSDTSRPASMVAYGGKENKSTRKKKKTTI